MAVPDAMHNCQHRAIDLLYKEFVRIAPCTASLLINIIDAISDSGQNSHVDGWSLKYLALRHRSRVATNTRLAPLNPSPPLSNTTIFA